MPRLHFPDQALVLRMVEHCVTSGRPLMLAHDHGLYLCTDGIKGADGHCVCAFVDGCDPDIDPEAHETANALVGFDDFGISMPLGGQDALLEDLKRGHRLAIGFGRNAVTIVTQAPTKQQPTPAARGRGSESQPPARTGNDAMTTTATKTKSTKAGTKTASGSGEKLRKAAIAEIGERIAKLDGAEAPKSEPTATEAPDGPPATTVATGAQPSAEAAPATKTNRGGAKAAKGGTGKATKAAKPTPAAKCEKAPAKRAKPAKEAKTKRISALDAAAIVLKNAKAPMNADALIVEMANRKLWASPNGQTPGQTLYAAITREIHAKGKASRFIKVERGMFAFNPKVA